MKTPPRSPIMSSTSLFGALSPPKSILVNQKTGKEKKRVRIQPMNINNEEDEKIERENKLFQRFFSSDKEEEEEEKVIEGNFSYFFFFFFFLIPKVSFVRCVSI